MTITSVPSAADISTTTREQMLELVGRHIAAEMAGDVTAAVAVYTEDVVHDVVGSPTGPLAGAVGATSFYDDLTSNFRTEKMDVVREHFANDAYIVEHQATGSVPGIFMGIPGHGRQVSFRMLHVFEFRKGLICRENIWLDGGSIMAQLTATPGQQPG